MSFQDFITVINECLKENDMEKLSKFRDKIVTRFAVELWLKSEQILPRKSSGAEANAFTSKQSAALDCRCSRNWYKVSSKVCLVFSGL